MQETIGDWTKVVMLCAILATGCTNTDGIIHSDVPTAPKAFAASGVWEREGGSIVSYRFSSFEDGETAGEFGGFQYIAGHWYYYDYVPPRKDPVNGHWVNNHVSFTVTEPWQEVYSAEFGSDNPTRVGFKDSRGGPYTLLLSDSP